MLTEDLDSLPAAPPTPHPNHVQTGPAPEPPVTPSQFAQRYLDFIPDPHQTEVLDSPSNRVILCCTRQWGKSTVAAIKAVHLAHTTPNQLILISSRTERQARLVLATTRRLALRLGHNPKPDRDNKLSLLFPNLSRIIALPGTPENIRGYAAVNLLIIDEAAYVADDLYIALQPMLIVSDGALWLLSTPYGKRGFFYQEWTSADTRWHRISVAATECPRIRPDLLDQARASSTDEVFRQEYMCEFTGLGGSFFDHDSIDNAIKSHSPLIMRRE